MPRGGAPATGRVAGVPAAPARPAARLRWLALAAVVLSACRAGDEAGVVADRTLTVGDGPALVVPPGHTQVLRHVVVRGRDGAPAVVVHGRLVAREVRVSGGGTAFRVDGGRLELSRSRIEHVDTAVWVRDGEARLRDVRVEAAGAAAIFLSGARLDAADLEIREAEYGVLARDEATLRLRDARIEAPRWAALGLTGARARIERAALSGGRHGGIVASDMAGPLVLRDVEIRDTRGAGLQLLRGRLDLEDVRVAGVSTDAQADLGQGVYLEDVRARMRGLSVGGAEGEGVVLVGGEALLAEAAVSDCGPAALLARRGAVVSVRDFAVHACRGPALRADEGARVAVLSGLAPEAEVRCTDGAEVRLPAPLVGAEADPCVRPLP